MGIDYKKLAKEMADEFERRGIGKPVCKHEWIRRNDWCSVYNYQCKKCGDVK